MQEVGYKGKSMHVFGKHMHKRVLEIGQQNKF